MMKGCTRLETLLKHLDRCDNHSTHHISSVSPSTCAGHLSSSFVLSCLLFLPCLAWSCRVSCCLVLCCLMLSALLSSSLLLPLPCLGLGLPCLGLALPWSCLALVLSCSCLVRPCLWLSCRVVSRLVFVFVSV
jgi:hypothetical protein